MNGDKLPTIAAALQQLSQRRQAPHTTYRLQMNKNFTFAQARAMVPYLAELGITDLYLSPILKAKPGSSHGYDICDHNVLNPELGTEDDFNALVEAARAYQMGLLVDFVPNHMGVDPQTNRWWDDVLARGPTSLYARYFDIDWNPLKSELKGKVLLPVLAGPYGEVLERGELRLVQGRQGVRLHYFDMSFPVNMNVQALTQEQLDALNGKPGDPESFDALHSLLEKQYYRLAYWKTAFHEINYRRFFDVNELAGLRMEDPEVFASTHPLILRLLAEGKITGLRLDHPDGLYDPEIYFEWLQDAFLLEWVRSRVPTEALTESWKQTVRDWRVAERKKNPQGLATRPLYLVVEKIISAGEFLPAHWPVDGTSGYEFLNDLNDLFIDSRHAGRMKDIYQRLTAKTLDFDRILYICKKLIASTSMSSELNVLAEQLNRLSEADRLTRDFTLDSLRDALKEVAACFPVYRTYMNAARATAADRALIDQVINLAKERNPTTESSIFDFIRNVLVPENAGKVPNKVFHRQQAFAMRFQQYTGPLQAKGLEDTAFYRFNLLVPLNEVGGDPRRFGITLDDFHAKNVLRRKEWPKSLLASSTHDTKFGEDVRARINVLSEMPDAWYDHVVQWMTINQTARGKLNKEDAPEPNDEYRFYQVLLGSWPLKNDPAVLADYSKRMQDYMIKACKEAKLRTSWIAPNEAYQQAVAHFVKDVLEGETSHRFLPVFMPFARKVAKIGMRNSLAQTLLKLTSPGIPDTYQGSDMWNFSLVDPDNRRPVDFAARQAALSAMRPFLESDASSTERQAFLNSVLKNWEDGRIKLFLTAATLRLLKQLDPLGVEGDYQPLHVEGPEAHRVIAFTRRHKDQEILVVAPRLMAHHTTWGETQLISPTSIIPRTYLNVFTGESLQSLFLDDILKSFPVALFKAR